MRVEAYPIRRMPAQIGALSYDVSEGIDLQLGDLVTLPLRGGSSPGIIFSLSSTYTGKVSVIQKKIASSVLSPFQRDVFLIATETHAVSLGTLLSLHLPSKRTLTSVTISPESSPRESGEDVWWYDDRQKMLGRLQAHIKTEPLTLILCPTIQAVQEMATYFPDAVLLHGETAQSQYGKIWNEIADREHRVVIGTSSALFFPFASPPLMVVDQEEHHHHKQSGQSPFLDVRRVVEKLSARRLWLSAAPSLPLWHRLQPSAPIVETQKIISRLDRGGNAPWIGWQTEERLVDSTGSILWLLPRRGYAASVRCHDCGWHMTCPHCGRSVRWQHRQQHRILCGFCFEQSNIPNHCPNCQSAGIRLAGLTADALHQTLVTTMPEISKRSTIASYDAFVPTDEPEVIVHACGEALLQYQDFAVEERAWQLMGRFTSLFPQATHIVQTWQADHLLWQRWLGDQALWYKAALDERQELRLPPVCSAWMVWYRGAGADKMLEDIQGRLTMQFPDQLDFIKPPQGLRKGTPRRRLMIVRKQGKLEDLLDWRTWFPHPWNVDKRVEDWLV